VDVARSPLRRLALDPFVQDAALALAFGVLTFVEIVVLNGLGGYDPVPPPAWPVLAAATIAPLAWRRRHPLATVAAQAVAEAATAVVAGHLAFSGVMLVALLVGAYSAGAHSDRRAQSLVVVVLAGLVPDVAHSLSRLVPGIPGLDAVFPLTAWLIGHAVRVQRRQLAALLRKLTITLPPEDSDDRPSRHRQDREGGQSGA